MGSRRFREAGLSEEYVQKVHSLYSASEFPRSADFCSYWFRKAHDQKAERVGLVGTNSISQGQSREATLSYVIKNNGIIHDAISTQEWSGEAAVHVSIVNWIKKTSPQEPLSPTLSPKGAREPVNNYSSSVTLGDSNGEIKKVINSMSTDLWEKIKPLAKQMRKEPTGAEKLLWEKLRGNKLGVKFRRQHPLEKFIIDFFSVELQLAIEVDGEIHKEQQDYDFARDEYLKALGIKTLRFTNEQVFNEIETVIESIKSKTLEIQKKHSPTLTPKRVRKPSNDSSSPLPLGEGPGVRSNIQCFLDGNPVSYISSSLKSEVDVTQAHRLKQNENVCFQGVKVVGDGFNITDEQALSWIKADAKNENVLKRFASAEIATDSYDFTPRKWIIDFNDMSLEEASLFKLPFEHVRTYVKPFRDTVRRQTTKEKWWQFGEKRPAMRKAIEKLDKWIAIPNVSKWTVPVLLKNNVLASGSIWVVASEDYYLLGVLTSKLHRDWVNVQKSTLEDRTAYTNTTCFETFPFLWNADEKLKQSVREIMKELDEFRLAIKKERNYGITKLYNEFFDEPASKLSKLHKSLDEAVCKVYGWKYNPNKNYNELLFELNNEIHKNE